MAFSYQNTLYFTSNIMRVFSIVTCILAFFGVVWVDGSKEEVTKTVPIGLSPLVKFGFRVSETSLKSLGIGSVGFLRLLVNSHTVGATLTSVASESVTGIGKKTVNAMSTMSAAALGGGLALTGQAMNLASMVVEPVPVVGSMAAAGYTLGEKTIVQLGTVGQATVDSFQKHGTDSLDRINDGIRKGAEYVNDRVVDVAEMVEPSLNKGFSAGKSGLEQVEKRILRVTDAVDSRLGLNRQQN